MRVLYITDGEGLEEAHRRLASAILSLGLESVRPPWVTAGLLPWKEWKDEVALVDISCSVAKGKAVRFGDWDKLSARLQRLYDGALEARRRYARGKVTKEEFDSFYHRAYNKKRMPGFTAIRKVMRSNPRRACDEICRSCISEASAFPGSERELENVLFVLGCVERALWGRVVEVGRPGVVGSWAEATFDVLFD